MDDAATLWDQEQNFWTSGLDNAQSSTAPDAVMIYPYPVGILHGDPLWRYLKRNTGWRSVAILERKISRRGALAVLTYRVSAEKVDLPIYEALCASTYFHDENKWLRMSHQQTPID